MREQPTYPASAVEQAIKMQEEKIREKSLEKWKYI